MIDSGLVAEGLDPVAGHGLCGQQFGAAGRVPEQVVEGAVGQGADIAGFMFTVLILVS